MFYMKLAFTNLKKNRKTYLPYLLTCIVTIMMVYVMNAIGRNGGLEQMPGADSLKSVMNLATSVTACFAAVFLFYTNSFLIKQRKKEFGLYQVLGMDKGNMTKMILCETLLTTVVSLLCGLMLGMILGKLMFLLLLKIIHFDVPMEFAIEPVALLGSLLLFLLVFFLIFIFNVIQVRRANPVELLHGGNQGEKEPKSKWLLTLIGVAALGYGYYQAQTVESPLTAIGIFFGAVILVIVGTYALFIAGSIVLLKQLRKKKSFYYKAKNFTAVSGMIYRMKQNAVGLANICIMSTVVLVLVSVSVSLYAGMEDIMVTRFPMDFRVEIVDIAEENLTKTGQIITEQTEKNGVKLTNRVGYLSGELAAIYDDKKNAVYFEQAEGVDASYMSNDYCSFMMIPLAEYNRIEEENVVLEDGEILLSTSEESFESDSLTVGKEQYKVKQVLEHLFLDNVTELKGMKAVYIVMKDVQAIQSVLQKYGERYNVQISYNEYFDIKDKNQTAIAMMQQTQDRIRAEVSGSRVEYRESFGQQFYALYGGFLFLGVFVGLLFLMGTVLIIYYKQISEGYDDRKRYQIMQQVGMNRKEIKRSIKSQVLTVFFLPLGVAVIHVTVAFGVLTKLLAVLNLTNVPLFFRCTIGTSFVFAVVYTLVFIITSRDYYKIVK